MVPAPQGSHLHRHPDRCCLHSPAPRCSALPLPLSPLGVAVALGLGVAVAPGVEVAPSVVQVGAFAMRVERSPMQRPLASLRLPPGRAR